MIYVVEDDEGVQLSLKAMLESKGFDVELFATGQAFLDVMDGLTSPVLLLDLDLPDMDGNEVIESLSKAGCDIPVIVMTGGGSAVAKQRALDLGAVTVLDKPLQNQLLIDTIQQYL